MLSAGASISGPGIPSGSTLRWLRAVRDDAPYALVAAALSVNGSFELEGMLRVDLSVPGAPALRRLALEGNQPAQLPGPKLSLGQGFDVASDGTFIFQINHDDAGTTRRLLLTDQRPRALDGTPAPLAGAVWNNWSVVDTGCAAGGQYVHSTTGQRRPARRWGPRRRKRPV